MGNHTSHQYDKDGRYGFQGGVVVGPIKANVQAQEDFTWPIIFLLAFLLVAPLVAFLIGYREISLLSLFVGIVGIIADYVFYKFYEFNKFYDLKNRTVNNEFKEIKNDGTFSSIQPNLLPTYENRGGDSTGDNNFQSMKIKSQEIKQLNITAVFSEIDHTSITAEKMRNVFELTEEEKKKSPFFEIPGIKTLIIPEKQKDVSFESNRLRVNDKSGKEPKESDLVQNFYKVFINLVDKTKLIAYGFNYDILVTTEEPVEYRIFIGEKMLSILNGGDLSEAGMRMVYRRENKRFDLQISPIMGQPKQFLIHLNVHYDKDKIEDFTLIQNQFVEGYSEIQKIITQLEK